LIVRKVFIERGASIIVLALYLLAFVLIILSCLTGG